MTTMTMTLTAAELKDRDPQRFNKAYWKWVENAADYEWWEDLYSSFEAKLGAMGIYNVEATFSGFDSQGDGAAFSGRVQLTPFMERHKLDEQYPALYIGVKNDGSYVRVGYRGNNMTCRDYMMYANQTGPEGIFAQLSQEAWEDLVDEQEGQAGLEDLVMEECEKLADELYRELKREYEYLTCENAFIESCELNEITFEVDEDTP